MNEGLGVRREYYDIVKVLIIKRSVMISKTIQEWDC